jgi:multimeric flavodoxin WrbA
MKKGVIILGSSSSDGNTYKAAAYFSEKSGFPIIDLKTKNIGQFDYEFNNSHDDFLPLIREIVDKYEVLIFATPVYWYSMSGIMKKFFDRISDVLKIEKETGRKLNGKVMGVISNSWGPNLKDGFYMPFIESSAYLKMSYLGHVHSYSFNDDVAPEVKINLDKFAAALP